MPELPEVETTRRGILPHVAGARVERVVVRESRLRWPVPDRLGEVLAGQCIRTVDRRAKYLLFRTDAGSLLLHLGMSGSLQVVPPPVPPPQRHDHVDLLLESGACLRYTDPRRFGSLHWLPLDAPPHPLLAHLGPEPLDAAFNGELLFRRSRGRRGTVKGFVMDGRIVVGVGNIYASEALFLAGINPVRAAGRISLPRYRRLALAIRQVLESAIAAGGTTLRDFVGVGGQPGYFRQQLRVYGRATEPCPTCNTAIRQRVIAQRASYYCPACQR
ncbi:bifunctional DNA-formamidopyrimidine glycosylase/DNA-(apurinic or apyrimidinic site) lyase [Methylonatrum kenyense]|uniref:bifunctional DNA-formamidopyrimidine glycosylase/DNA-(apurinic or apyrimidinic site) lyase n=1 Tax=Methylonatrum kenyense TaxID=455253 RepID=UPI00209AC07D|nr:bifunctional DNA-formamidopyrimidine glycosylase/DNA-(apurinic or apyrimidinic site) lyase [Methylonatrum kenyense]